MAASKSRKPAAAAAAPAKPAADEAETPAAADELVRVYPSHRRQAGPLVVAFASVDGHSPELVITDEGADVSAALADQLIAAREAVLEKPADPAEA